MTVMSGTSDRREQRTAKRGAAHASGLSRPVAAAALVVIFASACAADGAQEPPTEAPRECGIMAGAPLAWAAIADPNVVGLRDLDHPRVPIYVTADRHPLAAGQPALSRVACIAYPADPAWVRVEDDWRPPPGG
jgi:hypothetical protein